MIYIIYIITYYRNVIININKYMIIVVINNNSNLPTYIISINMKYIFHIMRLLHLVH